MDNKPILYGVIGLLLGVGLATYTASIAVNTNNTSMMRMMGMQNSTQMMGKGQRMMDMGSSMDDMMDSMADKSGDEFDASFISAMTVHHQGAIEMAQLAESNAKHPEIKSMAKDIISAQTSEINQMKKWMSEWGY